MGALSSAGLIYLVKILELLCGLALIAGFFVPLALLVLVPIIANISFFHLVMDPSSLVVSVALVTLWTVNARDHRDVFRPLLRA